MAGTGLPCISHHDWCAHLIAVLGNAIWVVALGDGCDALPQDQPVSICDSIMSRYTGVGSGRSVRIGLLLRERADGMFESAHLP